MRWLPRSLLGRVFALYAGTLVSVVACGVALFLYQQLHRQIEDAHRDAQALMSLVVPVVTDSAVIGDYDTIQRQLQRVADSSSIDEAEFVDAKGGQLRHQGLAVSTWAPDWLVRRVAQQLAPLSTLVNAGGTDYGLLRFTPASASIAGQLWRQALSALALALAGVLAGLALIRPPLVRWLGQLERLHDLGRGLAGGPLPRRDALDDNTPIEFRRTFEVLDRAASSVQSQREQAAATLQAIGDAVLACGIDGRIVLVNQAARSLLRRPADQLIGQPVSAVIPALAAALGADHSSVSHWQDRELLWTDPDGAQHVLEANLSPIVDASSGTTVGHVLACRDATEARQREATLRAAHAARDSAMAALRQVLETVESSGAPVAREDGDIEAVSHLVSRLVARLQERTQQLDAIFALSPDGFVSFDQDLRVRYASPGFGRLTGLATESVLGLGEREFIERLRGLMAPGARLDHLTPASAGDQRQVIELRQPATRVLSLALHVAGAQAVAQVLHLRDVTRETEVDRLKSEFVAAAAHELRTPMVGIYGFSELLMTREMPPERQQALLGRIYRQCDVMLNILNEMLDLARMEARHGDDFVFADTDLSRVLGEALRDFCPPMERPAPRWTASGSPLMARADAVKLQRALRNVLSNAYKYSPGGGDVEVRLVEGGPRGCVGIEVEDHGIGMTPAQLSRVGERFYRADESGTVLGTGLGMSLVSEIVRQHEGELALRSEAGSGTVVTLWLPRAQAASASPSARPARKVLSRTA